MKRVVILSPYFPPSTLAGVHRARYLAKHLPLHGWEPIVVCVHERYHEERLDPELAELVPRSARVIRVKALAPAYVRPFGFGDISLRAYVSLGRAVERLLTQEGADALLVTMSPYYPSLIGVRLARAFDLPLVLDYQDPWVSTRKRVLRPWSKSGLSQRIGGALEPRVLRWVSHITAVSEGTNESLRARYPALGADRFTALPIGGDPDDYAYLRACPNRTPALSLDSAEVNLCYVGTLWPAVMNTLRAVFRALGRLRRDAPELYARMRLHFVGTSYGPPGAERPQALPVADEEGVADRVTERPARVSYLDALHILANADVILALGSDEPHYTASKIYPCLLSGRPVLAFFHEASSVCDVVREAEGTCLVTFSDQEPALGRVDTFAVALCEMSEAPDAVHIERSGTLRPYTAAAVAEGFARVLDRVAGTGTAGPWW
jgi:hypothetical protein